MTVWLALINPSAGRSDTLRAEVAEALAARGISADLCVTESADHLQRVVHDAVQEGREHFIAVGGDGTASLVVDALMKAEPTTPPTLGILPAGSGSDFIRTFAIPQDLESAADHLTGDATYETDVVAVHGAWGVRYAINAVDIGILGATVQRAERMSRRFGRLRYQIAFWLTLPGYRKSGHVRVSTERRTWEGDAITIVLANGQFFGGGLNIAPKAMLMDGKLDVQIFACSKWRALALHPKVSRGLHLKDRAVIRMTGAEVEVAPSSPWPIEIDGDYLGETPATVKVIKGAIHLKI